MTQWGEDDGDWYYNSRIEVDELIEPLEFYDIYEVPDWKDVSIR
jgi:hypothetical protein